MRRIHDIPAVDRPREKLQRKGAKALSDFELIEVIVGSGTKGHDVGSIARDIQRQLNRGIDSINYETLTSIKGVSTATATKLLAAVELAWRHVAADSPTLASIAEVLATLQDIRNKQQEYLVCLSLDGGDRLIARRIVTIGTLDSVMAHPREVFADAVADRAASVIVAHNHPSGNQQPSRHDIELTQQLAAAGQLLGIELRDHLIVTKTEYFSFRREKML